MDKEVSLSLSGDQARMSSSKARIVGWAFWDWATQPFSACITTFVFSVYITSSAFGETNHTTESLSLTTTIAGIVIALLAPVLGQTMDRKGRTVTALRYLTWLLAIVSASLFFVRPDPSYLWLGLILMAIGAVTCEVAAVNYNALLDKVSTRRNVGRVSGFGQGMGYLGGIVVLLFLYFVFISPEVGLFGVTNKDAIDVRVAMIVCGLWMFLFSLPTFLTIKDPAPLRHEDRSIGGEWAKRHPQWLWRWIGPAIAAYGELAKTVMSLWRVDRAVVYFLVASAFFRDGLAGVFAFGAVIAAGTFGFSGAEVVIFGAAANIMAGVSTIAFGLLDDLLGPKKVIMTSLISLVGAGILIFFLHDAGKMIFWICGMILCMFVGPAQSASRSFLARIAPEGRAGEVFGLYATTGRAISFMSPAFFGMAIALGYVLTGKSNTQYWGILGIVMVLFIGLLMMIVVHIYTERHNIGSHKVK